MLYLDNPGSKYDVGKGKYVFCTSLVLKSLSAFGFNSEHNQHYLQR